MHKSLLAAAGLTAVAMAGITALSLGEAEAGKSAAGRSLAEALSQPHGVANGDPLWSPKHEKHQGQDDKAKGVDKGEKKQAKDVKTDPAKKPVRAEDIFEKGDYTGGCTVGYGSSGGTKACLPITPPSAGAMGMTVEQHPWTCREVRTLLPAGIALDTRGVDPAQLDSNGDGRACGPGDA